MQLTTRQKEKSVENSLGSLLQMKLLCGLVLKADGKFARCLYQCAPNTDLLSYYRTEHGSFMAQKACSHWDTL